MSYWAPSRGRSGSRPRPGARVAQIKGPERARARSEGKLWTILAPDSGLPACGPPDRHPAELPRVASPAFPNHSVALQDARHPSEPPLVSSSARRVALRVRTPAPPGGISPPLSGREPARAPAWACKHPPTWVRLRGAAPGVDQGVARGRTSVRRERVVRSFDPEIGPQSSNFEDTCYIQRICWWRSLFRGFRAGPAKRGQTGSSPRESASSPKHALKELNILKSRVFPAEIDDTDADPGPTIPHLRQAP